MLQFNFLLHCHFDKSNIFYEKLKFICKDDYLDNDGLNNIPNEHEMFHNYCINKCKSNNKSHNLPKWNIGRKIKSKMND